MTEPAPPDITRLLKESVDGDLAAREQVLALVYDELRRQARMQRHHHRVYETLNTTALVHETFLRLWGPSDPGWNDRIHFFRVAGRAMRNVLVDYARRRRAAKRGGGAVDRPVEEAENLPEVKDDEVLAINDALARLEALDARRPGWSSCATHRPEHRGNRRGPRDLHRHRQAGVGHGPRLAAARDRAHPVSRSGPGMRLAPQTSRVRGG
jgi:RNA polymerase sigma factor (TIGR02999 family)